MAVKVNLLPQDLSIPTSLTRTIKIIRAVNVISLAGFILFALGVAVFLVISSFQLQSISAENDQLTSQIKNLQTTEQKLVLLKDRVGKIKLAGGSDTTSPTVGLIGPLLSQLPTNASVNELTLDTKKITTSILFKSSNDVSSFFQKIYSSTSFSLASLTSFGFNPKTGYLVSLSLIGK